MTSDYIQNKYAEKGKYPIYGSAPSARPDGDAALAAGDFASVEEGNLRAPSPLEKDGLQRTVGAMAAFLKKAQRTIDRAEFVIAEQILRIRNLETLITIDELTNMLNRRGFSEAFRREVARVERGYNQDGLLLLIELENRDFILDRYGSTAFETCLRLMAQTLKQESRDMDITAHLDGGAFVMILLNAPMDKAVERAQILVARLNKLALIWQNHEIEINASMGLRVYGAGDKPEDIMGPAVSCYKEGVAASG